MEERGDRVQTDDEVANRRQRLVNFLRPLSEGLVGIDYRWQLEAEEWNSLPFALNVTQPSNGNTIISA
jgi:hypothetical protein